MGENLRYAGLLGLSGLGDIPQAVEALRIVGLIEAAGYEAWLVGGCIRDALMGRSINDIDIATSAKWQEVKRICESAGLKTHETGVKHGTITVIADAHSDGGPAACPASPVDSDARADGASSSAAPSSIAFEVTTYRADSPTSKDSRHPDSVRFVSTIEEDLSRRDFTMNALAWHPERGLRDPHGGLRDIEGRTIRAVGDPQRRFKEDALRILRACRFASQLGFSIDAATYKGMLADKSYMVCVSAERVTHELDLLLMGDHVHDALMATVDVLAFVLPELVAMKGCPQETKYHCFDVLEHTAWSVQHAPRMRLVRWAMLCHDMGKPASAFFDAEGVKHFYGHDKVGARMAQGIMRRMSVSGQFASDVVTLVASHGNDIFDDSRSVRRALMRLDGRVGLLRDLLDVKRADALAHAPGYQDGASGADRVEEVLDEVLADDAAFKLRDLAIDGNDVMLLGIRPGPEVGELLNAALAAVVDGLIPNDKAALVSYIKSKLHV